MSQKTNVKNRISGKFGLFCNGLSKCFFDFFKPPAPQGVYVVGQYGIQANSELA